VISEIAPKNDTPVKPRALKHAIAATETKSFQMAPFVRSGEVYESIHKAVQYKNSGAMQIATNMNESDGITIGLKRKASNVHSMPKKVRPLHESIVKVSQHA
jgi:hypothetical protein